MSELFLDHVDGEDLGYSNIRRASCAAEREIKDALQELWQVFEPYSDPDFRTEFARNPDERFWEMYLTTTLVAQGKNVLTRSQRVGQQRGSGPDIAIEENGNRIWIEAICPTSGDESNPDQIPNPMRDAAHGEVRSFRPPSDQIDLRITSALLRKRDVFESYRRSGIVGEADICVVAIGGGQIGLYGNSSGFSRAARAVYPIGSNTVTLNRETGEVVGAGYSISMEIPRAQGNAISRRAFLDPHFEGCSGLIWSRRSLGNFPGRDHDFNYVHNAVARRQLQENWFPWDEENRVVEDDDGFRIERAGPAVDRD